MTLVGESKCLQAKQATLRFTNTSTTHYFRHHHQHTTKRTWISRHHCLCLLRLWPSRVAKLSGYTWRWEAVKTKTVVPRNQRTSSTRTSAPSACSPCTAPNAAQLSPSAPSSLRTLLQCLLERSLGLGGCRGCSSNETHHVASLKILRSKRRDRKRVSFWSIVFFRCCVIKTHLLCYLITAGASDVVLKDAGATKPINEPIDLPRSGDGNDHITIN